MVLGSTQPLVKISTRNIPWGKDGRWVRLTTSPHSRAECHEIWEPKTPGTLWATPGQLGDSFTNGTTGICGSMWNYIGLNVGLHVLLFVILYGGLYVILYMGLYGELYVIIFWGKLATWRSHKNFSLIQTIQNGNHTLWRLKVNWGADSARRDCE